MSDLNDTAATGDCFATPMSVGGGGGAATQPKDVAARAGVLGPVAVGALAVILGIVLWQYLAEHGVHFVLDFDNVPTPEKVASAFWASMHSKQFYLDIAVSVLRVFGSFLIASFIGILVGIAIGRFDLLRWVMLPYIEILRPIPAISWIPLAIIMWPTTEEGILYITFLGAFFPVVLNTLQGVEATPKPLVKAAKSLGATELSVLVHVVLPSSLPAITSGLAIGMGVSWFSLVAGEMIGGRAGVGYYTWNAYQLIDYPDIVVGMITIGFLSTVSTWVIYAIRHPFLKWQR